MGAWAMGALRQVALSALSAILVSGCASFPRTVDEGIIEIRHVRRAIECELAIAALDPELKEYNVPAWGVKSGLDLTLVTKIDADGKVAWVLPGGPAVMTLTPSLGLSRRERRNAHLDFVTVISDAVKREPECAAGSYPSGSGLGLAAWFASTLRAVDEGKIAGLTYTTEFEVTIAPGARFGYVLAPIDAGIGLAGSWAGTHALTVAIVPPPSPPTKPKPIPVYIVDKKKPQEDDMKKQQEGFRPESVPPAPRAAVPRPRARPDLYNPNLDRLLQMQRPIRIER